MSRVFTALAVSVDGYITGSGPRPGHGLGDGRMLFDWYGDPRNAAVYEQLVDRVGAVVTGRTTYDARRPVPARHAPRTRRRVARRTGGVEGGR